VKLKIVFRYSRNHTQRIVAMTIVLKPEQEAFIQTQLSTGRYIDATAVIAEALRLLEKRNHYDEWAEDVRAKIDLAAAQLDRGEGIDDETAIAHLRAKLQEQIFPSHCPYSLSEILGDRCYPGEPSEFVDTTEP
jgi:antitoxin ParD1/3/4